MLKFCEIICVSFVLSVANANYYGPFMFWGQDDLKDVKLSALEAIDEKVLSSMFEESHSIMLFLRNGTIRMDEQNYPGFKKLIEQSIWAYLPQHSLPAEPIDFNKNVEIINLVGPASQQDVELTALYRDAVQNYGKGKVLGILANQIDEHTIYKREAPEKTELSSSSTTSATPTEEPPEQEDFIYMVEGKAILYTTSAPKLELEGENKTLIVKELRIHYNNTQVDERAGLIRLIIHFRTDTEKTLLRFKFDVDGGYWTLTSVDVEDKLFDGKMQLETLKPAAPVGFSYQCGRELIFRNGSNSLRLENIQVQPLMGGKIPFSDAYDCIGFTTVPIWSGVFVSFIILFGTVIGLLALMDIKPPNRFESNRNKQLTFTVQE